MDNQTTINTGVRSNRIYLESVKIARQYIGPAAERFIDRQMEQHLGRKPEDMTREDIPQLAKWVQISIMRLTNEEIALEFSEKISAIT